MAMTMEQFGQSVKSKYPQYKNVPDAELANKVLEKYPQYKRVFNDSQPAAGGNVASGSTGQDVSHTQSPFDFSNPAMGMNVLGQVGEAAKGAIKGLGSTIAGIGNIGNKFLGPLVGAHDVQGTSDYVQQLQSTLFKGNNTAQNIGRGAEQIAEFFVPGGAVSKAGKAIETASSLSKLGSVGKAALKLIPQAAADIGVAGAQSGGDVKTMRDAGLFSLGGGVVGGVAERGLNNFGNFLFLRSVPGTPKQLANDLKRGVDIGEALSKTGVSFTKGQLLGKVANKINILTNRVDEAVGAVGQNYSRSFDQVANDTMKLFSDKEVGRALEATPINIADVKNTVSDTIKKYQSLYAGKMLNPAEQHQLKQDIGVGLGRAWDKMLSTPIRAEAFTESKIYGALNDFLRKNIDGYENLNRQLAPLREAVKRTQNKGPYSGYLTDVISASLAGATGGNLFEDPVGFLKNALTGVLLKRGLTSTASKTIAGTLAKNLGSVLETPAFFQLLRKLTSVPSTIQANQQTTLR